MIIDFLNAAFLAGAPLILATIGEIITEKSGNMNLGVEGTMYIGAVSGLSGAIWAEALGANTMLPVFASVASACLCGMLTSAVYCFFTVVLRSNQNVIGLTITILGTGIGNFFGELLGQQAGGFVSVSDHTREYFGNLRLGVLSQIPIVGELFFSYNWLVYMSLVLAVSIHLWITRTKRGRKLIAVGENPKAADSAGISVPLYRCVATILGGGLAGLGGLYMCMVTNSGVWIHDGISGYGWLAVALVIFSGWNTIHAIFCSLIFGALMILRLYLQIPGISPFLYDMCPYLVTILVIVCNGIFKKQIGALPEGCGENYDREER